MNALAGLPGPRSSPVAAGTERGQGFNQRPDQGSKQVHSDARSAEPIASARGGRGPLVVVAGLPGAGKSTALKELQARGAASGLLVLDSASVRGWLQPRLARIPYPVLRPVVHTAHWLRVLASALTECRPLIVHETATRPGSRLVLRVLARCGGRPARLVWIDVPDGVALRGQVDRRRVIRPRAFVRHLRRVADAHPVAAAEGTWDVVYATGRDSAPAAIIAAVTAGATSSAAPAPPGRPSGAEGAAATQLRSR